MLVGNVFVSIILWVLIADGGIVGFWIAYHLLWWIFLLATLPFISMKKDYSIPSKKFNKLYVFACKAICSSSRVKIHVTGLEKVPFGTRFVLISNHRSSFDNVVQAVVLKKEHVCYISRPKNFKIFFAGKYAYRNSFLPLEKDNLRQNADTILKAINYLKEDMCSIGVYPEGTRSKTCELLEFKPGSLKIATKAKAPLIISSLRGTEQVRKNAPWKRTHVYVDFLEVINPEQYETMTTVDLADHAYKIINSKIHETN